MAKIRVGAGVTPCRQCPLLRLESYRKFTPAELRFMQEFKAGELKVAAGEAIVAEHSRYDYIFTLLSGWAFKYKSLADGRRQVTNFVLPGDLIGLHGVLSGEVKHSAEALTATTLCVLPRKKLVPLYQRHPGLAFDITWLAAREEWILAEYLLTVGQRHATERVAFVLLDLFRRARRAGLVENNALTLPLNQTVLSDTIGFSLVHTNKSLAKLRRAGCFNWSGTRFEMLNERKLQDFAQYDPEAAAPRPFL